MAVYIHHLKTWPVFTWDQEALTKQLAEVRHRQGWLLGRMEGMGFSLQQDAALQTLTLNVLKSSEIEGDFLEPAQVRSSIARRLGMDVAGLIPADRHVDGVVEMMLDATQQYASELSDERLFSWHAAMFPTGRSGMRKIVVGNWRDNLPDDPMQVVSGPSGRQTVHFQAPESAILPGEMKSFLEWFNEDQHSDPVIKAAIAHLWFVTIHPFDDGNGRIARAIADMQLSRADNSSQRFYSMSAQIRLEREEYYRTLEKTQKGDLNITDWLQWFLDCLDRSLLATNEALAIVLNKAKFWDNYATASFNSRQVLMLNKLLDGVYFGKLTSSKWASITKTSSDTAVRDINDLLSRGVLVKELGGGRSTNYQLSNVSIDQ